MPRGETWSSWPLSLVTGALLAACETQGAALSRERSSVAPAHSRAPGALPTATKPEATPEPQDRDIDWQLNPVMKTLGRMAETLTDSVYSHGFHVDERRGIYAFDCSGMAEWVLRRASPRAARNTPRLAGRPLARDFERRIAGAPVDQARDGWRRVARVEDAAPGDVVAWLKPSELDSQNTGHVAFIVLPPRRLARYDNAYLVRIADSTSLLHDRDTRVGRTGFGLGTILLVTDPETGAPHAYGWVGERAHIFETAIAIGRPVE